jgi:hypothetical protein
LLPQLTGLASGTPLGPIDRLAAGTAGACLALFQQALATRNWGRLAEWEKTGHDGRD